MAKAINILSLIVCGCVIILDILVTSLFICGYCLGMGVISITRLIKEEIRTWRR